MTPAAIIRIFESELEQITERVVDSPTTETGGELIGLWSHADSPTVLLAGVTIVLAGGPAPGSRRRSTSFEQDPEAHMGIERIMWEEFGVQVVGMWHSHHQLSLHDLSAGDVRRTMSYSARHRRPRYSEILAFLLPSEIRGKRGSMTVGLHPHVYENATTGTAVTTSLEILPGESPLRQALKGRSLPTHIAPALADARRHRGRPPSYEIQAHDPRGTRHDGPGGGVPAEEPAAHVEPVVETRGVTQQLFAGIVGWRRDHETKKAKGAPQEPENAEPAVPTNQDPVVEAIDSVEAVEAGVRAPDHSPVDPEIEASEPSDRRPWTGSDAPVQLLAELLRGSVTRHAFEKLQFAEDGEKAVIQLRLPSRFTKSELIVYVAGLGTEDMAIRASVLHAVAGNVIEEAYEIPDPATPQVLATVLRQGADRMGYGP